MDNLTEKYILELVKNLKDEPNPTYEIFKKNGEVASCNFIARTTGVVSGVDVVQLFYKKLSSKVSFKILKENSKFVNRGDVICVISGPIYEILRGEQIAINIIRYMSGIASTVAKYKMELASLDTKLLFSGHAAPGLEMLTEQAFADGGGFLREENKNYCVLSSNTIARFETVDDAINALKTLDRPLKPIVEVNDEYEFESALFSSAQIIRVTTSKEQIIKNCSLMNNNKVLEVQSEIELRHVRSIAKMGYKYIIIPSLSDSAKALPIDLNFYKRFKKIK